MDVNWTIVLSVLIIGVVFMFFFRKSIIKLISRINSIGKDGVGLQPQQSEKTTDINSDVEAEKLLNAFNSEMLLEQELMIQKELDQKEIKGDKACKVLVRHLAATQIAYAFETIHKQIWGSQIKALEDMNAQANGISRTRIKVYYDETVQATSYIGAVYSFEQWLNFLKSGLLLLEENNAVKITIRGRDFLLYLTRNGLNKNLPN